MLLRQADEGATIGVACRKAGVSEATFYVWRKKCAGLMPSEMKRLKQSCVKEAWRIDDDPGLASPDYCHPRQ